MVLDVLLDVVKLKSGVCCVNNMLMYFIGGVFGIFLLVMVLVVVDCVVQQNQLGVVKVEKVGSISMFVDEIVGKQQDGIIKVKLLEILLE